MENTETAQQIAAKLLDVRKDMADLRRAEKQLSTLLRKRIESGEDQDYFNFVPAITLQIEDNEKALKWAKKYAPQLITVNTTGARVIFAQDASLSGKMGTPEKHGFMLKETQQLRELKVGEEQSDIIE
jgi:hypothetical protein